MKILTSIVLAAGVARFVFTTHAAPSYAAQGVANAFSSIGSSSVAFNVVGIAGSGEMAVQQEGIYSHGRTTGSMIWGDTTAETILSGNYIYFDPLGGKTGGALYHTLGIGDGGQMVGYADNGPKPIVITKASTNGYNLLPIEPNSGGFATAISPSGTVVGAVNSEACLWDAGVLQRSGLSQSGYSSTATAINRSRQVVGFSVPNGDQYDQTSINPVHLGNSSAILWRSNGVFKLEELVTSGPGWRLLTATAINDQGEIVGLGLKNGKTNGYFFNAGVVTEIGISGTNLQVSAINNRSEVVGSANGRAFYWSNGVVYDLNTLIPANAGWTLQTAVAINDRGQITGQGLGPVPPSNFSTTYNANAVYRLNPIIDPNPQISPMAGSQNGMMQIQFFNPGTNWYFALHSTLDLTNWTYVDRSFPAAGLATFLQAFNTNTPQIYFRVVRYPR